jgi:hypothetical protein
LHVFVMNGETVSGRIRVGWSQRGGLDEPAAGCGDRWRRARRIDDLARDLEAVSDGPAAQDRDQIADGLPRDFDEQPLGTRPAQCGSAGCR